VRQHPGLGYPDATNCASSSEEDTPLNLSSGGGSSSAGKPDAEREMLLAAAAGSGGGLRVLGRELLQHPDKQQLHDSLAAAGPVVFPGQQQQQSPNSCALQTLHHGHWDAHGHR